VRPGHVALTTKVQANASMHPKPVSHERMLQGRRSSWRRDQCLTAAKAEILDAQEDRRYARGKLAVSSSMN